MKKLIKSSLLSVFMVSLLFACSEKDDEVVTTTAKLMGTWTYASTDVDITINDKSLKEFYMDELDYTEEEAEKVQKTYEEDYYDKGTTMEFNSNNKLTLELDKMQEVFDWQLSSDEKSLIVEDEEFEIQTLTKSKLSIVFEDLYQTNIDGDNEAEIQKDKYTVHFTK